MRKILFITYDGILEPLGYSQILSYLIKLSRNYEINILSIEKENDLKNKKYYKEIVNLLNKNNINWSYLRYSKNFKLLLILRMFFSIFKIFFFKKIHLAHVRSYIPAIICYNFLKLFNTKLIFDMRGFWIDERVDWNIWNKKSIKYILFKYLEKKIIYKSHAIVTLTNDASFYIKKNFQIHHQTKIYVIPTSTQCDYNYEKKNIKNILNLTYLGAIGTRYDFNKVIKFFNLISKKINTNLIIFNKDEHENILSRLKYNNISLDKFTLKYIKPNLINKNITDYALGIFFPVEGFYLKGYFPTKLGEFLSNGVPVVTCSINKHVDSIILENNVGIIINNFNNLDNKNLLLNIKDLINENTSKRCISVAKKYLNIDNAIETYEKIYKI